MNIVVDRFASSLSTDPQTAMNQLLSKARSAVTPQQQDLILKAAESISVLPGGTLYGISPFVDPREQFTKDLMKQFPSSAQLGQMRRAEMASEDRMAAVRQRAKAADRSAEIREKAEEGKAIRFRITRGDKNKKWKADFNRKISEADRRAKRLDAQLGLQIKRLDQSERRLKSTEKYRNALLALRRKANQLRGLSIADRRKRSEGRDRFLLNTNLGIISRGISGQAKASESAAKAARAAYDKVRESTNKLGLVNDKLTPADKITQQGNFRTASRALDSRLKDVEGLEERARALRKKETRLLKMLSDLGKGGMATLTDEDIRDLGEELFAPAEYTEDEVIIEGEE